MRRFMTSIAIGTLILGGLTSLVVATSASAAGPAITVTPNTALTRVNRSRSSAPVWHNETHAVRDRIVMATATSHGVRHGHGNPRDGERQRYLHAGVQRRHRHCWQRNVRHDVI